MGQLNSETFTSTFIKTLTRFQVALLETAADGEPFIVLEAEEGRGQHYADYVETIRLIDYGFLEDVSHDYRELIEDARAKYKRGFRVLIATPVGVKMFGGTNKRSVN